MIICKSKKINSYNIRVLKEKNLLNSYRKIKKMRSMFGIETNNCQKITYFLY